MLCTNAMPEELVSFSLRHRDFLVVCVVFKKKKRRKVSIFVVLEFYYSSSRVPACLEMESSCVCVCVCVFPPAVGIVRDPHWSLLRYSCWFAALCSLILV